MTVAPSTADSPKPKGLGTFAGVFTPSILTILGIILFLRLGFVVGDGGLAQVLVVILIANAISVLTSFSLAAIATNFEVRGGGDYYLISRTLGPEFGGAIGIVLFLAQSVSVAFYAIGFAEGAAALLPFDWLSERVLAGAALLPLFALSWMGSDWATRFQFGIMVVLALALGSFVVGAVGAFDPDVLADGWAPAGELGFWALFALFFPAVTGFTQGVSMSGELRDPARSLPSGTFTAVALSMVVYVAFAVLFAGAMPGAELIAGYDSMSRVAAVPALISAGIFAATLSSALASFLGAPRILQALAVDKLFGFLNPFAVGTGETGNPRRAVLLCFAIAIVTVALGNLNVVAPIVSMFFLISYGLLNYATFYEASTASPSFRPRFRWYHPWVSLLGCVACAGTMIAIDATAGAIAIAVLIAIHQYLGRRGGAARWADASRSAQFQRVRSSLHGMREQPEHDRDWRPVTLAFSDDPERRERIVRFASWIEGRSGITTAVRILEGEGPEVRAERDRLQQELAADIRARELEAFTRVVTMTDVRAGFPVLVQAAGLGPIRPNIALFNWFDREETAEDAPAMRAFGTFLRNALRNDCSVGLLAARASNFEQVIDEKADGRHRIDVWWRGGASSKLALLLAYLMTRHAPWDDALLRVLAPRAADGTEEDQLAALRAELETVRIPGEPHVVADTTWATIAAESRGTALAFIPFRVRQEGLCDVDGELLPASLDGLPVMALIAAARDIELDAQPDQGVQAELALQQDAVADATKRVETLRAEAETLRKDVQEAEARLSEARAAHTEVQELEQVEAALAKAREAATLVERKAAKAEAKLQELQPEVGPKDADA